MIDCVRSNSFKKRRWIVLNTKKSLTITTTFVGLVCGLILNQQQSSAATTDKPDYTTTSMVASQSSATTTIPAKNDGSIQNNQTPIQPTNSQKAANNTNNNAETANQNQTYVTHSTASPEATAAVQSSTSNNNSDSTVQPQQAAASLANSANENTQPVSQYTAPANPQANKSTNSANNTSTTTDPQLETIAQGTWGTSKWEYTHQGDDYILHFHEGTFGASSPKTIIDPNNSALYHYLGSIGASPEIFNSNWQWSEALTQIIIDPGVIANRDSSYLFGYLKNLKKIIGLANLDTTNVTNMSHMFDGCSGLASLDLGKFNTDKVTDTSRMFWDCNNLTNLDLNHFNTSNVTDMSWMFGGYQGASLDLSKFNTANVTNMAGMFDGYQGSQLDLNNFDTSKVTDMSYMFAGCALTSLNLSYFNTANVTNMSGMFLGCYKLNSLDLSKFNTDNVTDMSYMFDCCNNITSLDLNNFNTAKVTDMRWMFYVCSGLTSLDLSSFSTINVTNMYSMFAACDNLNHLILGPDTLFNTYAALPHIPKTGTNIPGKDRVVASPYWVATIGYQQGHKYTADELMGLTGRNQVTTYDWDSTPAFTHTTETKAVTRAIRIHQPDGSLKTELQTVMVHRPVTINPDGSKTYGAWSTAQWDAYQIPEIAGYQASDSSIAAQTVNGETVDETINVHYQPQLQTVEIQYLDQGQIVGKQTITGYTGQTIVPNYQVPEGYEITTATPATITIDGSGKQIIQVNVSHKQEESMEYKTITRTVNLHQTNGQIKTYNQVALLQRSVQIDIVTGNETYGHWNTGYWDAINIPTVAGYTASQDQVAAQLVTDQDSDQTVDVYYTPTN